MTVANIVFCPRKTASFSIAKSWSLVEMPVLHTHDMYRFVVTDVPNGDFYEHVEKHFSFQFYTEFSGYVQYSINTGDRVGELLEYFSQITIVSSLRAPLARRVSQFLQSVTIEQVNAMMDATYPEWKRLGIREPDVAELCHVQQKMKRSSCPIIHDALNTVFENKGLLTKKQALELFEKHFLKNVNEFTEFFRYMQTHVDPDFDMEKIASQGHDTQEYDIDGKSVEHLLFRLEDVTKPGVVERLIEVAKIDTLAREHDSKSSHHLFQNGLKEIKHLLMTTYANTAFSVPGSVEDLLCKGLGY